MSFAPSIGGRQFSTPIKESMKGDSIKRLRQRRHQLVLRRAELRDRIQALVELPMVVLAFVMLCLLVLESMFTLEPWAFAAVAAAQLVIWIIFAVHFAVQLVLADDRWRFLRTNWIAAVSVLLPPARVLRVARLAPLLRTARLGRTLGTVNRSVRALRLTLDRRRFGFVLAATLVVVLASAASVLGFEQFAERSEITTAGAALWWAAATITTMSPGYDPVTTEGRVIGLLVRIYAVGVFSYLTATVAAHFIGVDTRDREGVGEIAARLDSLDRQLKRISAQLSDDPASQVSSDRVRSR